MSIAEEPVVERVLIPLALRGAGRHARDDTVASGAPAVRPADSKARWGRGSRVPLAPWRPGVVEVGRGYVRLRRRGRVGERGVVVRGWDGHRQEWVVNDRRGVVGRGDSGMSGRSRLQMQRLILSLPWELLTRPSGAHDHADVSRRLGPVG